MKKEIHIMLIFLLTYITGCDYYDDRLVVNNKNTFNIYVTLSSDTILYENENNTFMMPSYFIKANDKKNIIEPGSKKAWEFQVEKSLNKQLHIFILSEDTLKKYDKVSIIKMKKYEKRIDVGLEELKTKNWEITYE